jgi:hypothetical protein
MIKFVEIDGKVIALEAIVMISPSGHSQADILLTNGNAIRVSHEHVLRMKAVMGSQFMSLDQ